jgi:tRNA-splicing ligase RtcB
MDLALLTRKSEFEWWIAPSGKMHVPGIIYASEQLIRDMDLKVYEQVVNVATLPGIQKASYAMPDAHWGYGFPIGGVAAFDPEHGGVVSAGGVGFDISTARSPIARSSLIWSGKHLPKCFRRQIWS